MNALEELNVHVLIVGRASVRGPSDTSLVQTARRDFVSINEADSVEGGLAQFLAASGGLQEVLAGLPEAEKNFEMALSDDQLGTAEDEKEAAEWETVNDVVFDPHASPEAQLSVEEVKKREAPAALHYGGMEDINPSLFAYIMRCLVEVEKKDRARANAVYETYLRDVTGYTVDSDTSAAGELIQQEARPVGAAMGHEECGGVSVEGSAQVREECVAQVLEMPQHKRSTGDNLMLNMDPMAAAEKRQEMLRDLMRGVPKQERNPLIVLVGYQSRALTLIKVIEESLDRIKICRMKLATLEELRQLEIKAIFHRIEVRVWISNGILTVRLDRHESCTTLAWNCRI